MGVIHDCRFLALQNGWVMEICCTMMGMRLTYCTVHLEIVERVNLMFFFHNMMHQIKRKLRAVPYQLFPLIIDGPEFVHPVPQDEHSVCFQPLSMNQRKFSNI